MLETKLAALRIDVSKETGEIMMFIETACGFRPVMGWPNVNGLCDFANKLLGVCSDINGRYNYITDKVQTDIDALLKNIDEC